jgi:putative two-component system response regulator
MHGLGQHGFDSFQPVSHIERFGHILFLLKNILINILYGASYDSVYFFSIEVLRKNFLTYPCNELIIITQKLTHSTGDIIRLMTTGSLSGKSLFKTPVTLLIVDDESAIREMLKLLFEREGYHCLTAENGHQALKILESIKVDAVVTDINMPGMNGIELLRQGKKRCNSDFIVITGYVDDFTYDRMIEEGASDFIYKPVANKEMLIRLKRVLRERSLLMERERITEDLAESNLQLKKYTEELNQALGELKSAHEELRAAYLDTINRLVIAAEFKDEDTGDHILRISLFSALIAEKIGLSSDLVANLRYAAPMHDIGKIGIPDKILLKPACLTRDEFEIIKTHTTIGASILAGSKSDVLRIAHDISLTHHEKWNGQGYPHGLKGEKIPITGRIVGLLDVFDALTSPRPYKQPYPIEITLDIIKKDRERHFDPMIVDAFESCIGEISSIKKDFRSFFTAQTNDMHWSERDIQAGMDKIILGVD